MSASGQPLLSPIDVRAAALLPAGNVSSRCIYGACTVHVRRKYGADRSLPLIYRPLKESNSYKNLILNILHIISYTT